MPNLTFTNPEVEQAADADPWLRQQGVALAEKADEVSGREDQARRWDSAITPTTSLVIAPMRAACLHNRECRDA
jgi:hypothetical protein